MAFETGTASGHIDLWDSLLAFLTTDATLIIEDAEWEVVWTHPSGDQSGVVLKGKGSSGSESILVGLSLTTGLGSDNHHIEICGMTGFDPDALSLSEHINISPATRVWLDSGSMKYWFVANARRFVIVANMSTVYEAGYAGFLLPYASPLAYPYPMFIGGSSNQYGGTGTVTDWRSTSDHHQHFLFSNNFAAAPAMLKTNAWLLDPLGAWRACSTTVSSAIALAPRAYRAADPDSVERWGLSLLSNNTPNRFGSETIRGRLIENFGGGMTMDPVSLVQETPSTQNFGILDGVFLCPGRDNAAENLIQIGAVDHLVIQNVWRTAAEEYWALRLE